MIQKFYLKAYWLKILVSDEIQICCPSILDIRDLANLDKLFGSFFLYLSQAFLSFDRA